MGALNRSLQKNLLIEMERFYPQYVDIHSLTDIFPNEPKISANLHYLAEHRLIDLNFELMADGTYAYGPPRINQRGMDFLADDGGLEAIIGVVTIKLHDETIRSLLEEFVEMRSEDTSVKASAIKAIRNAPASAIQKFSEYAIQKGLENLPGITPMLQMLSDR